MKGIPITPEFEDELYSQRMLLFVETEPHSNNYSQAIFTKEEFKQLSNLVFRIFAGRDVKAGETIKFRQSVKEYKLPDLKNFEDIKENPHLSQG